jgi:hypothetical protein
MGEIVEEPPLSFELPSSCDICNDQFKGPGTVERPTVLPCGHIFGNRCIKRWMQGKRPDSEHEALTASDRGGCPICRRKLVYRFCGHAIIPKTLPILRDEDVPVTLPVQIVQDEEDMPVACFDCSLRGLPENRRFLSQARGLCLVKFLYTWADKQDMPHSARVGLLVMKSLIENWERAWEEDRNEVERERLDYLAIRGPEKW